MANLRSREGSYQGQPSTLLHLAVETKDGGVLAALLASGANPSLADTNGMTPLHLVVRGNQLEAVKKLLAAGAVIDVENAEGHTPLSLATGPGGQAIAQLLIHHGAKPSLMDATALADRQGVEAVLESSPGEVNYRSHVTGMTALDLAALFGSLAGARSLLDAGADPNAVGSFTPLQLALLTGRLPLVELLLERGARADLRGKFRQTPLEYVRGGILRRELLERFLAEPGLVLQSSTVAVPPQYAVAVGVVRP